MPPRTLLEWLDHDSHGHYSRPVVSALTVSMLTVSAIKAIMMKAIVIVAIILSDGEVLECPWCQ